MARLSSSTYTDDLVMTEKPVEIRYVTLIKEVPVEVIKEVVVEKIITQIEIKEVPIIKTEQVIQYVDRPIPVEKLVEVTKEIEVIKEVPVISTVYVDKLFEKIVEVPTIPFWMWGLLCTETVALLLKYFA